MESPANYFRSIFKDISVVDLRSREFTANLHCPSDPIEPFETRHFTRWHFLPGLFGVISRPL